MRYPIGTMSLVRSDVTSGDQIVQISLHTQPRGMVRHLVFCVALLYLAAAAAGQGSNLVAQISTVSACPLFYAILSWATLASSVDSAGR